MIVRSTYLRVLITAICLSGCTGDDTSISSIETLLPLWVVDADKNTGLVQVSGRVTRRDYGDQSIRSEFDLLTHAQDIGKFIVSNEDTLIPTSDSGVRLVERDRMRVVSENGVYQLRRREALFNYRTQFPIGQNLTDVDLRLDYAEGRFDASVTSIPYVNVTDFTIAEDDVLLNASASVNLSWNVSTSESTEPTALIQRVNLALERCDSTAMTADNVVLSVPDGARSFSINIGSFPVPDLGNPVSGVDSGSIGICHYRIQLVAAAVPVFLLDDSPPFTQTEPETRFDAVVVNVGRSETGQVQVNYENE